MKKAFTLIELLVVIAIIGILATVVVVNLSSAQAKARDASRKSDMNTISKAIELYYQDHETYFIPATGSGGSGRGWFNFVYGSGATTSIAQGLVNAGYFSKAPQDPSGGVTTYGKSYMFSATSSPARYVVYCGLEKPVDTADPVDGWDDSSTGSDISGYGPGSVYLMNYRIGN